MVNIVLSISWHENRYEYSTIPTVYSSETQSAQKVSIDNSGLLGENNMTHLDKMVLPTSSGYYPGMENKTGDRLDFRA